MELEHWMIYYYPLLQLDDRIQEVYKTEFGCPATAATADISKTGAHPCSLEVFDG